MLNAATTYTTQNPGIITNGLVSYIDFGNPNCWMKDTRKIQDLVNNTTGASGSFRTLTTMSYNANTSSLYSIAGGIVANRGILGAASPSMRAISSGSTYCFWTNYQGPTNIASPVFSFGTTIKA